MENQGFLETMQKGVSPEQEAERREVIEKAAAIMELSEMPQFAVFMEIVDEILEMYNQDVEVLLRVVPNGMGDVEVDVFKVARFVGARESLCLLKSKVDECKRLIERQAKANAENDTPKE